MHGFKLWGKYVDALLLTSINKSCCQSSFSSFIKIKITNALTACPVTDLSMKGVMKAPCSYIHYGSWFSAVIHWLISVPQSLMVNFTIAESYIPYTEWCFPHSFEIHDGHQITNYSLIDKMCGKLTMESVYSKCHKMYLMLTIQDYHLHIYFNGMYQVHMAGEINKLTGADIAQPKWMTVNVHPNVYLLLTKISKFMWYVSNSIHFPPSDVTTNIYITNLQITLNRFIVLNGIAMLQFFPGLLSHYWVQWKIKPQEQIVSDIEAPIHVMLNFHMHATVVLVLAQGGIVFNLDMDLEKINATKKNVRSISISLGRTYTHNILNGNRYLHHGALSSTFSMVYFDSFEATGYTTVMTRGAVHKTPTMINRISNMPTKISNGEFFKYKHGVKLNYLMSGQQDWFVISCHLFFFIWLHSNLLI